MDKKTELEYLRKRVSDLESEVKEIKTGWKNTIDAIDDIVLTINMDYEIEDINTSGLQLLGKEKTDVTGQKCYKLFHQTDTPVDYCPLCKSLNSKKTEKVHVQEKIAGKYFSLKSSPVLDDKNRIQKFVDVMTDITEMKKYECELKKRTEELTEQNNEYNALNEEYAAQNEELRTTFDELKNAYNKIEEKEELFRTASSLASDYSYSILINEDGTLSPEWSFGQFREITGYTVDEVYGSGGPVSLIHPYDEEKAKDRVTRQLKGETVTSEMRIITKQGETRWIRDTGKPVFNEQANRVVKIIGAARDITSRMLAFNKLQQINRIINRSPAVVFRWKNEEGWPVEFVTSNVTKILGYEKNKILSNEISWEQIIHPGDLERVFHEVRKHSGDVACKSFTHKPYRIRKSNGEYIWVEDNTVIHRHHDMVTAYEGIIIDISERVRAEQEVYHQKNFLEDILGNISDTITRTDTKGNILYVSPSWYESVGYTSQDVINTNVFDYIHPDDKKCVAEAFQSALSGHLKGVEYRFLHKNGNYVWCEARGKAIKGDNGNITGAVFGATVIEERKKALDDLRESQERFKSLFENSKSGIFYINTLGDILEANPAIVKMLGSPSVEMTKKINVFQFEPLVRVGYAGDLKKCIDTGELITGENVYTSKWGKTTYVQYYFNPIRRGGEIIGVLASNEDITEKKKAEQELQFQALLLDNINDFVTATDLEGNITYVNNAVVKNLGKTKEEYLEQKVQAYGENPEKGATQQEIVEKTLSDGRWKGEVVNIDADGKEVTLEARTQMVRDEQGNPVALVGISTDISERKKFENEIRNINEELAAQNEEYVVLNEELTQVNAELQKVNDELVIAKEKAEESEKLKTAFLANMSHEIRTPMNGIIGFSEMLLKPSISEEKKNYFAKIIINNGHYLLTIINDILDLSRIESGELVIEKYLVSLNTLMDEVYDMFRLRYAEKNIGLHPQKGADDTTCLIESDKVRLNQVLTNLLSNALKFTPKGYVKFGYKNVADNEGSKMVQFFVQDTGIGIPENLHDKIFDRFRQGEMEMTKHIGGAGLGLAISKRLVNLLGGKIWLDSESGRGTIFYFTIPCNSIEAAGIKNENVHRSKPDNEIVKPQENNEKKYILVAEDEEYNYVFIEEVLSGMNVSLVHAGTGDEAIEICKKNNPVIDLVLMDIKMPGMNGIDATRQIKQFRPDLPIIAQTAFAMRWDKEKALNAGCDDYISKPINHDTLIELVEQYLNV
jgi:PAS domain S-box-containing protein